MNDILRIGGIALCGAMLAVLIKHTRPEFTPIVSTAASVILLSSAIITLSPLAGYIRSLTENTVFGGYVGVLLKSLGITLASSSVSDICRDMGEGSIASKVELAAKAEIMLLSMPLVERMIKLCTGLLAGL